MVGEYYLLLPLIDEPTGKYTQFTFTTDSYTYRVPKKYKPFTFTIDLWANPYTQFTFTRYLLIYEPTDKNICCLPRLSSIFDVPSITLQNSTHLISFKNNNWPTKQTAIKNEIFLKGSLLKWIYRWVFILSQFSSFITLIPIQYFSHRTHHLYF